MAEPGKTLKRVYEQAGTAEVAGGFEVRLDGRTVRTPGRAALVVPSAALAEAVAAEWRAQEETVRPDTMPMMSLACTAIDRTGPQRAEIVTEILRFAETDVLCHRAETPPGLVRRQSEIWQPLLDWAAQELEAPLRSTSGILAVEQPPESLAALRCAVEALDDLALTALSLAVAAAGSLVIGLALLRGRLDPEGAFAAAELDASYQIELWGEDPEATRRRAVCRADLEAAARLSALL